MDKLFYGHLGVSDSFLQTKALGERSKIGKYPKEVRRRSFDPGSKGLLVSLAPVQPQFAAVQETLRKPLLLESKRSFASSPNQFWEFPMFVPWWTFRIFSIFSARVRGSTNFRGWRKVWGEPGENRGGTGGEPGAPKRTRGEPGAFGKRTGREPGAFGIHSQRVPGEKRGLWDKNRGRTGGGNFL